MAKDGEEGNGKAPESPGEEKEKLRSRLESRMKGLLSRPGKGDRKDDGTGGEMGAADGGAGAGAEENAEDQPKPGESKPEEKKPEEPSAPPADEPAASAETASPAEQADAKGMKNISESPANAEEKTPAEDKKEKDKPSDDGENEKQKKKESGKAPEKKADEDDEPEGEDEDDDSEEAKKPEKKGGKREDKKGASDAGMPNESLEELQSQKDEIEALLSSVEDSYRDATLPDKTYREVKEKNEKKLADINVKIEKIKKAGGGKDLPSPTEKATGVPSSSQELEDVQKRMEAEASFAGSGTSSGYPGQVPGGAAPSLSGEPPSLQDKETKKAEALIKILEQKIEDRLKDVIASASVEVTDKRLRKMETKVDELELLLKSKVDVITGELRSVKSSAESVSTYDKQFTSMKTDIEKVKALVDSVKEAKNIVDEKMQRVVENFAEIRSIVYQREANSKEQNVLMDKLKDTVSQIDSARILREFTTRDEQMRDVNTRVERLERTNKMNSDSLSKIKGLMTDIGSLENIIKASKHVGEKLERIQEIEERQKATTSRLDGVYVDMKKKLDEFNDYKIKQDKLNGMVEDVVKNVEEVSRRLSDYATKADVTSVKDELKVVRQTATAAASAPHVQTASPAASGTSPEVSKLREQKSEIETMLATLEENFNAKAMSEDEYNSAREKNMQKLVELEKKISAASSSEASSKTASGSGGSHSKVMLLAKLKESYENGEISRNAYEKSRRVLLGK